MILEGNIFDKGTSSDDIIDFLGSDRPGPVFQVLNNIFLGGNDDGLDLDGTDAHVEGNIFTGFHLSTSRPTTSNAIATGLPQTGETNRTQITVVRNLFYDNDHAMLLKEDAFGTMVNNVFADLTLAGIQVHELGGTLVGGPGRGDYLDGNIFYNVPDLFKNIQPTSQLRSTVQSSRRRTSVAALATLPPIPCLTIRPTTTTRCKSIRRPRNGSERPRHGRLCASGASIDGEPSSPTTDTSATLTVGGPDIYGYKYRVNDGPWSGEVPTQNVETITPVVPPIVLTNLAPGTYIVRVIAKNSAGVWQSEACDRFARVDVLAERHGRRPARVLQPVEVRRQRCSGQCGRRRRDRHRQGGAAAGADVQLRQLHQLQPRPQRHHGRHRRTCPAACWRERLRVQGRQQRHAQRLGDVWRERRRSSSRPGAGVGGSSRVTLIWPSGTGAIKQWLQVTVKANANTGLATPDVFYFGNAVGESGNVPGDYSVSLSDELLARNNPVSIVPGTTVTNKFDFNRDGTVSVIDQLLSRNNITTAASKLKQITVPAALRPSPLIAQGLRALAASSESMRTTDSSEEIKPVLQKGTETAAASTSSAAPTSSSLPRRSGQHVSEDLLELIARGR